MVNILLTIYSCFQLQDSAVQLIAVSGYTPCYVYAVYDLWSCYTLGGTLSHYSIMNFKVGLISNGCDSLKDRWDSLETQAYDYDQLNYEVDLFMNAAKSSLEYYLMGQFFSSSAHRDSFPCENGQYGVFTSEFYSANCYKICVVEYPNATPPYTTYSELVCGTSCCKKETPWCWDGEHFITQDNPSYTEYGTCGSSSLDPCSGSVMPGNCDDHVCEP